MSLPLFFLEHLQELTDDFSIGEDSSRHVIQVLRMKTGQRLQLTNGNGLLMTAEITMEHKKDCRVRKITSENCKPAGRQCAIAISLVKNPSRFEWFLEKATEIGVSAVIPMICKRTERQHFRTDRMKGILVSAMLQSRQTFLPSLPDPVAFSDLVTSGDWSGRYIASCEDNVEKKSLHELERQSSSIILIGPEGDFTAEELDIARANGFLPVSLGDNRLRTETAGVVAAALMRY